MPQVEIHYATSGDWAALYVDGQLDHTGDPSPVEANAFALLGVTTIHDDAFMRGGRGIGDPPPAQTLDEVAEYRDERERRRVEAARKREQAAALLAEAESLESVERPAEKRGAKRPILEGP